MKSLRNFLYMKGLNSLAVGISVACNCVPKGLQLQAHLACSY